MEPGGLSILDWTACSTRRDSLAGGLIHHRALALPGAMGLSSGCLRANAGTKRSAYVHAIGLFGLCHFIFLRPSPQSAPGVPDAKPPKGPRRLLMSREAVGLTM